ncbi:glycoside hydrolase family 76 protein [Bipolaris maydis ATCC 48331]|uniref:Glycoside hydrolase family 76 protein n=2 Tax=Cochliobolus heterostrophus TaxID=5016 RepID=M2TVH4_COCH5|nr:glycoside hydrolase family 76 protein [Bipolaris maydis ATCC 48331]EMD90544.1 glycoside hydrolase family 76 protein [Bipolaris maydis C5]KAJ5023638.1 glycoside hydrolase [Bipolaris maydis]ENI09244.1 glycoside hydrolase family 76 protein [Bipolaris maydis ATCC 48331]KAJ6269155.1 glycoside hydrolase [Bipolaris maydis]KAJ6279966.1 glycoside hydrolase [Bipolaris maydis]
MAYDHAFLLRQYSVFNVYTFIILTSLLFSTNLAHLTSPSGTWVSRKTQLLLEAPSPKRDWQGPGPEMARLLQVPVSISKSGSEKHIGPGSRAKLALSALQTWYNETTGLWETTGWWNAGNIITTFGDYAKAFPEDADLQALTRDVFSNALARAPIMNPHANYEDEPSNSTTDNQDGSMYVDSGYTKELDPITYEPRCKFPPNWKDGTKNISNTEVAHHIESPDPQDWLDGFNDDDLWWALAWINAYDVTNHQPYLDLAEGIFLAAAKTWGTYCDGGIYWSWKKNYVNAIANELFLSTAAHLANRVEHKKETYLDWAMKSHDWFFESGMININGTVNDGLTEDCENNNKTVWSYNQGVILGGLVELQRADSPLESNFLEAAHHIARAAISALSGSNGVIHDVCEPECGFDGGQFKGAFMRNLVRLQQAYPDDMFSATIHVNAESIWKKNREMDEGLPFFGVDWDGPFVDPADASSQSSAMDALVGAVVTEWEYYSNDNDGT